jgi:hypothetical protein
MLEPSSRDSLSISSAGKSTDADDPVNASPVGAGSVIEIESA